MQASVRFELALVGDRKRISDEAVSPVDSADLRADARVTDVVFVIHGIRDNGYWTHKIARPQAVGRTETPPRVFATDVDLRLLSMLSFLLPSRRRDKVAWLTNRYVRARAANPEACFSTWGTATALTSLPRRSTTMRPSTFLTVVFAGSVVRRDSTGRAPWPASRSRRS